MIRVRLAEAADQPALIEFIREHWSETHVFTKDPDLFAWQYLQHDGRLNLMLAEEEVEGSRTVLGILGFIPMGRFDAELGDTDITLAIWKVVDSAPPGLGLRLLKRLTAELSPRMIAAIGISDIVKPIYGVLRYELGCLSHAALFDPEHRGPMAIASGVPPLEADRASSDGSSRVSFTRLEIDVSPEVRAAVDDMSREAVPAKSWTYVAERFLAHPWYAYTASLVHHDGAPVAVVIWRRVEANGASALRIVDIVGAVDWLADSRSALLDEVRAADAEYMDLMQWGVPEEAVAAAGFIGPNEYPDLVIPNYFSPFQQRNVRIDLSCRLFAADDLPVRLFRADSDQDRPNLLSDRVR